MNNQNNNIDLIQEDNSYRNFHEYYEDELSLLDLKIISSLSTFQSAQYNEDLLENFKGVIITKKEVERLLCVDPTITNEANEFENTLTQISALEERIAIKLEHSIKNHVYLPLESISNLINLSDIEKQCLIMCLAVELDRKYEKLYGFLQDDIHLKKPTIDLALKFSGVDDISKLEARKMFSRLGKLERYFLHVLPENNPKTPLLATEISLDERAVNFLIGNNAIDNRIASVSEVFYKNGHIQQLLIGSSFQTQLQHCINKLITDELEERNIAFNLYGQEGSGKKTHLKHLSKHYNQHLLIVNMEQLIKNELEIFKYRLLLIIREAIFQNAILAFDQFDSLIDHEDKSTYLAPFLFELQFYADLVFFISKKKVKEQELLSRYVFLSIELPNPTYEERVLLWGEMSMDYPIDEQIDWKSFANKFRFTAGQIDNVLRTSKYLMQWEQDKKLITSDLIHSGCYQQIAHNLETKAVRIQPNYQWNDLILPKDEKDQLRNACNQVKYRQKVFGEWGFDNKLSYGKGISMLFAGPPGTGKTMSAEIVANELKLELYKVDLSQIISKYIGETEKNLKEIFNEAKRSHAILFFDETDALFGKRSEVKDSKDKYANIEVAYLLQKMEEYDGITILATNFLQNIDDAFIRRINYIIKYPFPDVQERITIWKTLIPKETPLASDLDFPFLGEQLKMAGGNIKNTIVTAAFLAVDDNSALGMKHIIQAAKYELQKTGKVFLKDDLREYSYLLSVEQNK